MSETDKIPVLHHVVRAEHLPGMMILEKPNFLVMDTPWENTDEYSLLICSMSPCSSWRLTAKPETSRRHRRYVTGEGDAWRLRQELHARSSSYRTDRLRGTVSR